MVASTGFILILATRPRESLTRQMLLSPANIPGAVGLGLLLGAYLIPVMLQRFAAEAQPAYPDGPVVHIVQPDIGQGERWDPGLSARHLARLQSLSGGPGTKPRLILWPESAIEDNVQEDPAARATLASILGPNDLLLGGGEAPIRDAKGEMTAARNSIFVVGAGGKLVARYDKAHLVPFGEYLPLRPLLSPIGLSRLVPGDARFPARRGAARRSICPASAGWAWTSATRSSSPAMSSTRRIGRASCSIRPTTPGSAVAGPPQHLAQARLRAIEEGLPIVRATPTGSFRADRRRRPPARIRCPTARWA